MTDLERKVLDGYDLDVVDRPARANLLLIATDTRTIDLLEEQFSYRLSKHPEIRHALYAVDRQSAQYRRDQAPNEPLPKVVASDLSMPDLLEWLKTTRDPHQVDALERATEGRLKRYAALREVMFEAARLSVDLRAAAQTVDS